ncbi:unnamed protein product [Lymnaea stagnalis]|uniref:RNA helicase n=1 Tax=Lymnaea stagnalis TaxID=6523 RepID=A0AAV2I2E7_LYMST
MSEMDQNSPEDMAAITECIKQTLIKYLQPAAIKQKFISLGHTQVSHVVTALKERQESAEDLLTWILESDENNELISAFVEALRDIGKESKNSSVFIQATVSGPAGTDLFVNEYLPYLIGMIDGSLIRKLTTDDLHNIFDHMAAHKLVLERDRKRCKSRRDNFEFCYEMFRSVKDRNPDWPFVFLNAVSLRRPSLLQLSINNGIPPSEDGDSKNNNQTDLEIRNVPSDAKQRKVQTKVFESTLSEEVKEPEAEGAAVKYDEPLIPKPPIESEAHTPRGFSSPPSIMSDVSVLSIELSTDYIKTRNSSGNKRDITNKELKESNVYKEMIVNKFIDQDIIKDESNQKTNGGETESSSEDMSDGEAEDVDKIRQLTEAPPLELREYQKELAEIALQGLNTIICAPTGSGKTRVATHIILEHLKKRREGTVAKKKTIAFLARTVPLTVQQGKVLRKAFNKDYKITHIIGSTNESLNLKLILNKFDVIVMTPMILVNHLESKTLRLRHFSLLIFDECHHTRKDEPYNRLMFFYLKAKYKGNPFTKANLPQIIGMSASIGIEKARTVKEATESILKICGNLDAPNLSTVIKNESELRELVPVPEEKDIQLKEREEDDSLNKVIEIMNKMEDHIKHAGQAIGHPETKKKTENIPRNKKSQEYGQWAVDLKNAAKSVPIIDKSRETNSPVRTLMIATDYLWAYSVAIETHDLVELKDVMVYLRKRFEKYRNKDGEPNEEKTFYGYFEDLEQVVKRRHSDENPNLIILAETLVDNLVKKGKESRGIIFVKTRALAEALASWLNRCGFSLLEKLNAHIFTGTNAKEEEGGMSSVKQEEVIKRFRSGDIKVLVATSVAEEGLDIPDCNLVIKYNHVGNEITTVQTKGRSRKHGGVSILLAMDDVLRREYVNREKAKVMKKAFKKINEMDLKEKQEFIDNYQKEIMQTAEIEEALAANRRQKLRDVDFSMVCPLCRKVCIEKRNIRTIFDKFRVSIDRNLLNGKILKCVPMKQRYVDELEMVGPVFCRGQPKLGTTCGHKLGQMIKYGGVPYFAMRLESFGFYKNSTDNLDCFKKWKDVPYITQKLTHEDIVEYIKETQGAIQIGGDDDDDQGSSDDEETQIQKVKRTSLPLTGDTAPGDEANSVTLDDVRQNSGQPHPGITGSLARKVESELGKAPTLNANSIISELNISEQSSISIAMSETSGES